MERGMRTGLTTAAVLGMLLAPAGPEAADGWIGAGALGAQDAPGAESPPFLEVSGSSTVEVPTDRAHVRVAVVTEAGTAREASAANARRMEAVIAAVRETGLSGLQVETTGYDVQPRYNRPERGDASEIVGYQVTNHVEVTLDEVEQVGRVIDAAIAAGANRVASLSFEATNTTGARQRAVREAVEKAREEAEAMAAALGATLGEPLEVRGGANVPGPQPVQYARMEMAMADQAPSTPVEPGEQLVFGQVTIRYRLITGR